MNKGTKSSTIVQELSVVLFGNLIFAGVMGSMFGLMAFFSSDFSIQAGLNAALSTGLLVLFVWQMIALPKLIFVFRNYLKDWRLPFLSGNLFPTFIGTGVFFCLSMFFSILDPYSHNYSVLELFNSACFFALLYAGMHLFFHLPFLYDEPQS